MRKILKKNHFIEDRSPETFNELLVMLAKEKSVYFAPLDRVMPTAFFKGYIWGPEALNKHIADRSFHRAERKDLASRRKIKSILKEIPVPKRNLNRLYS